MMRARMFLTTMSVLSLLFSASVLAHITEPGGVLPHIFTGEHLLILLIVGVCIAAVSKIWRRSR
jgi:hypothetical protein